MVARHKQYILQEYAWTTRFQLAFLMHGDIYKPSWRHILDLMNDLELFFEAQQGCFKGLQIIRYVASYYQAVFTVFV